MTVAPLAVILVILETVPKEAVPVDPAVKVKFCAPVMVPVNATFAPVDVTPPFVASATTAAPSAIGPVNVIAPPLVVKLPFKLIAVVPVYVIGPVVFVVEFCVTVAPVAVKLASGVVPPTAPKETVPPDPRVSVKLPAPFVVLDNVIAPPAGVPPPFVVSIVAVPLTVIAPLALNAPPFVVNVEVPELKVNAATLTPAAAVVALIVPKIVVALAVLVNPFVNVKLADEPLCNVTPPVFEKVVAGVIVPPLLNTTP